MLNNFITILYSDEKDSSDDRLVDQVHDSVHMENAYSIDETRLAYEEAKNALLLVSRVMSTNTQQLEALSKMTDAASGLALINKFHQGAGELQVLYKFEESKEKITIKQ